MGSDTTVPPALNLLVTYITYLLPCHCLATLTVCVHADESDQDYAVKMVRAGLKTTGVTFSLRGNTPLLPPPPQPSRARRGEPTHCRTALWQPPRPGTGAAAGPSTPRQPPPDPPLADEDDPIAWAIAGIAQHAETALHSQPAGRALAHHEQPRARFALTAEDMPQALQREWRSIEWVCTTTSYTPLRYRVYRGPISEQTLLRLRKDFLRFMGYLKTVRKLSDRELSGRWYSNPEVWQGYVELLEKRNVSATELAKQTETARKMTQLFRNIVDQQARERHQQQQEGPVQPHEHFQEACRHLEGQAQHFNQIKRMEKGTRVR